MVIDYYSNKASFKKRMSLVFASLFLLTYNISAYVLVEFDSGILGPWPNLYLLRNKNDFLNFDFKETAVICHNNLYRQTACKDSIYIKWICGYWIYI